MAINKKNMDYVIGIKQVMKALVNEQVKEIYIAVDAEPKVTKNIFLLCQEKRFTPDTSYTMVELGKIAGIEVKAATIAVVNAVSQKKHSLW